MQQNMTARRVFAVWL